MPPSQAAQTLPFTPLPDSLSILADTLFPQSLATVITLSLSHLSHQTTATLAHWLHEHELTRLSEFKFEKRHREWLGGRICAKQTLYLFLQQAGKSSSYPQHHQYRVASEESGRPYFPQLDDVDFSLPRLSISHSKEYATALISRSHCGIDIQYPAESLERVKKQFTNANEEQLILQSLPKLQPIARLAMIWTGKEAIKKMLSPTGMPGFHQLRLTKIIQHKRTDAVLYFTETDKYHTTFPVVAGILSTGYSLALCCQT